MKRSIADFENPYAAIEEFEQALSDFTGAPGVVVTDSCTHAIELGLRIARPKLYATLPAFTYISVLMTLKKLGIEYMFDGDEWDTHYKIEGSPVYDCARYFKKDMFEKSHKRVIMAVSFGHGKPLEIGHGGAILTNDKDIYKRAKRMANDGRDLSIENWIDQEDFEVGYHYHMRPEDAVIGLNKLAAEEFIDLGGKGSTHYPDLNKVKFNES